MSDRVVSFRQLIVWQKAHIFALNVYKATQSFPIEERYSLVDQLKRAVVSITSNISEGFSRYSNREKAQFYSIAKASSTEVENQLLFAHDLGYINKSDYLVLEKDLFEVQRLLQSLITKIKQR